MIFTFIGIGAFLDLMLFLKLMLLYFIGSWLWNSATSSSRTRRPR